MLANIIDVLAVRLTYQPTASMVFAGNSGAPVLAFEVDLKSGRAKVTTDIMRILGDWLVNHIISQDNKYTAFSTVSRLR